jgi:hypothetical protein
VKIPSVAAILFHGDRRSERHDEANSRLSPYCERARNEIRYVQGMGWPARLIQPCYISHNLQYTCWPTLSLGLLRILLYMFRATSCSSSEESIVSIQRLVYVTLYLKSIAIQCILDTPLVILDHSFIFRVTYTRCCVGTIDSSDDEHEVARNM